MPARQAFGPEENHPGWWYIELLYALREMGDLSESGFVQTVAKLCETKKWSTPEASLRAACQYADAHVAHNQNNNYGNLVKAYNLSHAASSAVLWRQRLREIERHQSIKAPGGSRPTRTKLGLRSHGCPKSACAKWTTFSSGGRSAGRHERAGLASRARQRSSPTPRAVSST